MTINSEDISYAYDTRGYMMFYKGKPIGGAGISKYAKSHRGNLKLFRDAAEATKNQILRGCIDEFMRNEIIKIEKEN